MVRIMGFFAIIPATILLSISFFVLLVLRKAESQGLKAFGYVIASLLWLSSLLVVSMGIYTVSTGRHPGLHMMQEMMKCKMQQGMMPAGHMGPMMPSQK